MSNGNNLLEEILALLGRHHIRLDTDHRGQHLLVSQDAITSLISAAEISAGDTILEIGPGPGQLTKALCETGAQVVAVEIDERFKAILSERQSNYPNLNIVYGSILDVAWPRVDKIVANPPFSILEPLVAKIADEKNIHSAYFVLGRQYYERCNTSGEWMARTALITKAFFNVRLVCNLDKEDFYPRSREKAVVMSLKRKDKRESNFGMRVLAARIIGTPHQSALSFVQNLIAESIDLRRQDYRSIPTTRSIGICEILGRKKLGELDNKEISALVKIIESVRHYRR